MSRDKARGRSGSGRDRLCARCEQEIREYEEIAREADAMIGRMSKIIIEGADAARMEKLRSILLEASALFSTLKISDLTDPSQKAKKSGVEIHHLFPKEYLKSMGFKDSKTINQVANYAYLEWQDNDGISNDPPSKYYMRYTLKVTDGMIYLHALPKDWERMTYETFLVERRKKNGRSHTRCI